VARPEADRPLAGFFATFEGLAARRTHPATSRRKGAPVRRVRHTDCSRCPQMPGSWRRRSWCSIDAPTLPIRHTQTATDRRAPGREGQPFRDAHRDRRRHWGATRSQRHVRSRSWSRPPARREVRLRSFEPGVAGDRERPRRRGGSGPGRHAARRVRAGGGSLEAQTQWTIAVKCLPGGTSTGATRRSWPRARLNKVLVHGGRAGRIVENRA